MQVTSYTEHWPVILGFTLALLLFFFP